MKLDNDASTYYVSLQTLRDNYKDDKITLHQTAESYNYEDVITTLQNQQERIESALNNRIIQVKRNTLSKNKMKI